MEYSTELKSARAKGIKAVDTLFEQMLSGLKPEEQAVFTDSFWRAVLQSGFSEPPDGSVWFIAIRWHGARGSATVAKQLPADEEQRIALFLAELRQEFIRSLLQGSRAAPDLPENMARAAILMWRDLFLSSQSILNQQQRIIAAPVAEAIIKGCSPQEAFCRKLLSQSLLYPFDAERLNVDAASVLSAAMPLFTKIILVMWLVNIPRYNATQFHRQKVLDYLPIIFRFSRNKPTWLDPFFHLLAEWLMITMFRLAYIHEDNSLLTRLFGDFIHQQMSRFLPQYSQSIATDCSTGNYAGRIRLGYVSGRFVTNAVTFYMGNRILRHDPGLFEIHLFAIGDKQDDMTRILAKKSDHFVRLQNPMDYPAIAQAILDSKLDILVFADIGMEIHSYLLAGLRLAPIQVALLGHASPTGLPTIDYFISSEAEAKEAEHCYRERLIRLPGPGADQILPPGLKGFSDNILSRKTLGIPENAFVFVSCAHGMKHIPERDYLWLEILRQIPRAYILLKPFSPGDSDCRLRERINRIGSLAGASDRIRCLDSCDSHQQLMALLALADVQLDTYPFNGWTTTIEAMCLDLPTVTQEGRAYRSRLGAAFLRAIGICEGIAADEREYLQWAVRFANEPELCRWVRSRIKATRVSMLFENHSVQTAYENALLTMVRGEKGVRI